MASLQNDVVIIGAGLGVCPFLPLFHISMRGVQPPIPLRIYVLFSSVQVSDHQAGGCLGSRT